MNPGESSAGPEPAAGEVDTLRNLVMSATQRLLGDTISVSDEAWGAPSKLPDWSRAHVATHIARHADALVRVVRGALSGRPEPMYASSEKRAEEIAAGAGRSGLDLQIDLDTSAGSLSEAFEALDRASSWDTVVQLRGGLEAPARLLPLARLSEVVLHHVDLGTHFGVDDIDGQTAEWLLEWCAFRLREREDFPKLTLLAESGFHLTLGSRGEGTEVRGESARLLGWLTGRSSGESLSGAAGLGLPAYA
jgi:maleylpyruvate isomerase